MTEGGKRRLAAIVNADVVGYSRLVGADEIGALSGLGPQLKRTWEIVGRTAPAHPLRLAA